MSSLTKYARSEATRDAIMAAAESIFAEVGFAAARLEDVALAVGIRRPSIIYYFAGKQELYDAVEADIFASMHLFTQERLKAVSDPVQRLLALLDAWLDFYVARPTAARIIQRLIADVSPRQGDPIEFSQSALEDLERVVDEGVAAGAFRRVSPMLLLNGVAAGVLYYVCNGGLLGEARAYDPAAPAALNEFRELLHTLARAAVAPPGG
jgi:TetR/AcrR family transcriptional regulator